MVQVTVVASITILFSTSFAAFAQTAPFACPKAGTVAVSSKGTDNKFGTAGPDYCSATAVLRDGTAITFRVYAPSVTLRESLPQDFATRMKVSTLWPLQVGKSVKGRFSGINQIGVKGSWDVTITVGKYEKVTIPAGTYDTFLVTHTQEADGYKGIWRYWYAPSAALTVKWDYADNKGRKDGLEIVKITQ